MKIAFALIAFLAIINISLAVARPNDELQKRLVGPLVEFNEYPFVVSIVAMPNAADISYSCTGTVLAKNSKDSQTFILTTAFCANFEEDQDGKSVTLKVLAENPNGSVELNGRKFNEFPVIEKFVHPDHTKTTSFTLKSSLPGGIEVTLESLNVPTNDVGILKVNGEIENTVPVKLGNSNPEQGTALKFLGYGGPDFFNLKSSMYSVVLKGEKTEGGTGNSEAIFFNDDRVDIPLNETEAVEVGDEGGPMLNSDGEQIGVVQGTFTILGENGNANADVNETLASVGPSISHNYEWIQSIITPAKPTATSSIGTPSLLVALLTMALGPVLLI